MDWLPNVSGPRKQSSSRLKRLRREAAMRQARTDYAEAFRIRALEAQEKRWRQAERLSAYLSQARERVDAMPDGTERTDAEACGLPGCGRYAGDEAGRAGEGSAPRAVSRCWPRPERMEE
ncbi:putative hypothetical protein [Streptomyces sp. NBRC 110611]|uniref:hypothetical protein n=1 Tax=Streptomyces sp. NBRC 110611 TaxID=1621259 RepID=UPI00085611F7|nr:hypothetical protein [Streptomyces sp. NBRC 110611]GAU65462.1 putative hypothetical protein [Streptomyces sp. NBRC 110611]